MQFDVRPSFWLTRSYRSFLLADLYRIARLSRPYIQADCVLRILEVDILSLELGKDHSIFPEGAIPVDGLVFCYDATNPESFKYVPPIMSKSHTLRVLGYNLMQYQFKAI